MGPIPIPQKTVSLILGHSQEPDEGEGDKGDEQGLQAAAEDLISAVHGKDASGVVDALKNAFAILDSQEDQEEPDEGSEQTAPQGE